MYSAAHSLDARSAIPGAKLIMKAKKLINKINFAKDIYTVE